MYRASATPVLWRNMLLIGGIEGYVHIVNTETGELHGYIRATKSQITTLTIENDTLLVYDNRGKIVALALATIQP